MKLRVWHIPQLPMEPFYVEVSTPEEGALVLRALANYDLFQFEKNVKPDYCNAQGLEVFEDGEWVEWHDDQDEDTHPDQEKWRLKPEGGVTEYSLHNGRLLRKAHGLPRAVALFYQRSPSAWPVEVGFGSPEYVTKVTYQDGHIHEFTGFAWGYGGEGPHGLAEWAKENEIVGLDWKKITSLPNDKHYDHPVWAYDRV